MKQAKEVWTHRIKKGTFGGTNLRVVGETVALHVRGNAGPSLRALDGDGQVRWEIKDDGIPSFRAANGVLYVDGRRALRVSPATGEILTERDFGRSVLLNWMPAGRPVVAVDRFTRLIGLDPEGLSTLWEWPDPEKSFTADRPGQLCGYDSTLGLRIVDLSTMTERAVPAPGFSAMGLHGHVDDLWCEFAMQQGGRLGIDLNTGEVVWRSEIPAGYGLTVFHEDLAISNADGLVAYDMRTGEEVWRQRFGFRRGGVAAAPRVVDGRLYVGTTEGCVHVVDCRTGRVELTHKVSVRLSGLGIEPSPVVPMGDDRLVVGMRTAVVCLEIS